jgi:hypothetical protein
VTLCFILFFLLFGVFGSLGDMDSDLGRWASLCNILYL